MLFRSYRSGATFYLKMRLSSSHKLRKRNRINDWPFNLYSYSLMFNQVEEQHWRAWVQDDKGRKTSVGVMLARNKESEVQICENVE